ncbi:serine threonine-protein kinase [Musa troglodytarum]|uniref:Receptor-like serine/threonine-protein kinase n=1 Tax=Musa troglodytarum TaxID=320322 RepID=A0A9E7HHJ8_9LILI|nr:serine threonine-protein kinase [Musa troglodytarum]
MPVSFAAMAPSMAACAIPLYLSLLVVSFLALHQASPSYASDTISPGRSLSGHQNITSAGGQFVLGFFTPTASSKNYYVGIWYNKISLLTAVWVANRETPVTDPSTSELRISDDGNLVLLDRSKGIIWSTGTAIPSNSTVAVILDDGNLQLRDAANSSQVFWQSFDHPCDTWLPGATLGLNKLTNQSQTLTAWRNKADPAPGIFSLEIDPNGTSQYYILWKMSRIYWTSGVWNDHIFNLVPEMNQNYIYDFQFVNSSTEMHFRYTVKNDSITSRQQCLVYALCGPFGSCNDVVKPFCKCIEGFRVKNQTEWDLGDQSGGCERKTPLHCGRNSSGNSETDAFLPLSNMRPPDNSQILATLGSDEDCESACLNNCSCTAYSYNATGCFVWYGALLNLQDQYGTDGSTLHLRLAASELQSSKSKKGVGTWIIVGVVVVVIIVACLAILLWRRRSRRMMRKSKAVGGSMVPFTYRELRHATKNFSHKLGGGGFGSVFEGSLPDSTVIAVKKLEGLYQGEKQFRTEVSTIGTIQHVNLVRLLGFCSEGSRKLLVYEFMPKGSLDTQLFRSNSTALDWKTRYQIAVGTARGLAYLHEQCRDCIIHCDIKPENILLDASFVPKVADFGLAKLVGRDFSRVLTTMRGTRGYLAPEWITGVAITAKADVYSYGMMLLEIVSGRRNSEQTEDGIAAYFPKLVATMLVADDVESLLDPRLGGDANLEEVERACKLACWCIQDGESCRPTMGQVVQVLEGFLDATMPPIPRSILLAETPEEIKFFSELSSEQSSQTSSCPRTQSTKSNSSGV